MADPVTTSSAVENPTVPASPSSYAPGPAQPRPGAISDEAFRRLGPDERAKYTNVRGANGGEWIDSTKLSAEPVQPGTPSASTPAPGDKVKIGDFELSANDVAMLIQQKAAADLRATQIPATAEAYEAKLPDGFKLPDGMAWQFDPKDPALIDAQRFASRAGLTQSQFSELLSVYASQQMADQQAIAAGAQREMEKLGPNATQRVSAIETFIRGIAGDELGTGLRQMVLTQKHVLAWEKIAQQFASQGVASYRAHGREPPDAPGKVSEEQWGQMSHGQRLDYARQFDQRAFRTGSR
jgi:hypothetical protein